jgi:5-methylcytosine-specific restriction endonuclease McrA
VRLVNWWSGREVERARAYVAQLLPAPCPFCHLIVTAADAWDVDHARPRAYGGQGDPGNLRPAHADCNRRAGQVLSTRRAKGIRPWPPR